MELDPAWLLDKAIRNEIDVNWADAYEVVCASNVPAGPNIIGSHIIYKIKLEERVTGLTKSSIIPKWKQRQRKRRNSERFFNSAIRYNSSYYINCSHVESIAWLC